MTARRFDPRRQGVLKHRQRNESATMRANVRLDDGCVMNGPYLIVTTAIV